MFTSLHEVTFCTFGYLAVAPLTFLLDRSPDIVMCHFCSDAVIVLRAIFRYLSRICYCCWADVLKRFSPLQYGSVWHEQTVATKGILCVLILCRWLHTHTHKHICEQVSLWARVSLACCCSSWLLFYIPVRNECTRSTYKERTFPYLYWWCHL